MHVWGPEYRSDLPSLRVFIQRVREKLGDDGESPRSIQTERGVGYRFLHRFYCPLQALRRFLAFMHCYTALSLCNCQTPLIVRFAR